MNQKQFNPLLIALSYIYNQVTVAQRMPVYFEDKTILFTKFSTSASSHGSRTTTGYHGNDRRSAACGALRLCRGK